MNIEQLPGYNVLSQMSDQELTALFGIRDFFVYELDFAAVAAAASPQSSFTVQADSNFLWQQGVMFADIAAATQTQATRVVPSISLTITDTGSGRQLMSANTPAAAIFGYQGNPYTLPTPRFFRAQTQVTVALLNFDAAATYNIKLQFIGTKFFKYAKST